MQSFGLFLQSQHFASFQATVMDTNVSLRGGQATQPYLIPVSTPITYACK